MKGRTLMGLGIACIIGVAAAFGPGIWLPAVGLMILWIIGLLKAEKAQKIYLAVFSAFLILGFLRGMAVRKEWEGFLLEATVHEGGQRIFSGRVTEVKKTERSFQCYLENGGEKILCRLEDFPEREIYRDDRLTVKGECRLFSDADNPGQYDEADYNRSIQAVYKLDSSVILSHKRPVFSLTRLLDVGKERMAAFYSTAFPENVSGVVQAMVLGDKSDFQPELKNYYKANGWLHLVTVSGLHMGFIGAGLYRFLRKRCHVGEWTSEMAAVLLTTLYSLFTGFGFSLQRAWIMFLFQTGSRIFGRTNDFATSTVLSAAAILMRRPMALTYSGLWFSYAAMAGMAVGSHMWETLTKKDWISSRTSLKKLCHAICIQAAIFFTTLPVLLYFSYEIPLYGLLYSLWLIPVISKLIPYMMVVGLTGSFGTQLPGAEQAAYLLCQPVGLFFQGIHGLPAKTWIAGFPSLLWVGIYVLTGSLWLALSVREKGRSLRLMAVRIGFGMSLAVLIFGKRPEALLTCLDVGQGDGLCMMTPEGRTVLIDGGSSSVSQVGIYRILPFLKYYGRQQVDMWFLSHSDEDHISGCREIIKDGQFKICMLILPEVEGDEGLSELADLAKSKGITVRTMAAGDRIRDGETSYQCLYPDRGNVYEDKNTGSLVLLVTAEGGRFLFTGDLTEAGEKALILQEKLENVDILKVAHHGSAYSTTIPFLEQISPACALISAGSDNRYGHPAKETLERLEKQHILWKNTAESGAIFVRSQQGQIIVQTYHNP